MSNTINAKFANGVFTPLEPVGLPEGAIVALSIEDVPVKTPPVSGSAGQFVPHNARFLPGMEDPQKIKQILVEEDVEHHINASQQGSSM